MASQQNDCCAGARAVELEPPPSIARKPTLSPAALPHLSRIESSVTGIACHDTNVAEERSVAAPQPAVLPLFIVDTGPSTDESLPAHSELRSEVVAGMLHPSNPTVVPQPHHSLCAALGAALRRTPPFSLIANMDWESVSSLEEGLFDVLIAEDWDHRVALYRKKVSCAFRNRVFVQSVVAAVALLAFAVCSGGYVGVVGGIILYLMIVSEQYKATKRITDILDHSECHAGYLRSRLAQPQSAEQGSQPETDRRFSDDPAYLPEPPPIYDLARTEPPAYGPPPMENELTMEMTQLARPQPAFILVRSGM